MISNEINFNWTVNDNLNKWKLTYNLTEVKIMSITHDILSIEHNEKQIKVRSRCWVPMFPKTTFQVIVSGSDDDGDDRGNAQNSE